MREKPFQRVKEKKETFMTKDTSLKYVLAILFAIITFSGEMFGQNSYVFASDKKQGGSPMASSENQTTAGTASGNISLNGIKISLNYAYALAQPNAFDENKLDIAVLLTEKPVSEDELKDVAGLEHVAYKKHNYVLFKINDQGKPIYEVVEHPVLKNTRLMMSGFTWAEFASGVFSRDRIEGSFNTKTETDFSGYKYHIAVSFNALIRQAKLPQPLPDVKTGKALPQDGGDPAKAYLAYRKAIEKKDIAAIRKHLQMPAGVQVTDDEMKENLEFMASVAPKNLKISKGYVNSAGDKAAVYVTGTEEGEKRYGTIGLIRRDAVWMVTEENWSDTPPKK